MPKNNIIMYPIKRNRRLRTNEAIRSLVRETIISPNDFLVPLFIVEGKGIKEEIASMPNYYRYSLDLLQAEVKELWKLGLKSVLLFVKVPDHLKDNKGTEAINPGGLMQRAIKTVKNACPDMLVMTDVALDPYSVYGHDGILEKRRFMFLLKKSSTVVVSFSDCITVRGVITFLAKTSLNVNRFLIILLSLPSKTPSS